MLAFFLTHWFQFNYAPPGQPFYDGAVWPNVFVVAVVAPLGWLWSKTKFWPLRPMTRAIEHVHRKLDAHAATLEHLRSHAEHQTRIAQDHYERAFGERHPHHGRLDHLSKGDKP